MASKTSINDNKLIVSFHAFYLLGLTRATRPAAFDSAAEMNSLRSIDEAIRLASFASAVVMATNLFQELISKEIQSFY